MKLLTKGELVRRPGQRCLLLAARHPCRWKAPLLASTRSNPSGMQRSTKRSRAARKRRSFQNSSEETAWGGQEQPWLGSRSDPKHTPATSPAPACLSAPLPSYYSPDFPRAEGCWSHGGGLGEGF